MPYDYATEEPDVLDEMERRRRLLAGPEEDEVDTEGEDLVQAAGGTAAATQQRPSPYAAPGFQDLLTRRRSAEQAYNEAAQRFGETPAYEPKGPGIARTALGALAGLFSRPLGEEVMHGPEQRRRLAYQESQNRQRRELGVLSGAYGEAARDVEQAMRQPVYEARVGAYERANQPKPPKPGTPHYVTDRAGKLHAVTPQAEGGFKQEEIPGIEVRPERQGSPESDAYFSLIDQGVKPLDALGRIYGLQAKKRASSLPSPDRVVFQNLLDQGYDPIEALEETARRRAAASAGGRASAMKSEADYRKEARTALKGNVDYELEEDPDKRDAMVDRQVEQLKARDSARGGGGAQPGRPATAKKGDSLGIY